MCAALFALPVIGVPLSGKNLDGMDAVFSIMQMPPGVPVATVAIDGAKNAALAILAAAIMTDETVRIENLPDVNDINVLLDAIAGIGAMVQRTDRHTVKINAKAIHDFNIEYDYIKKIRASYYLLGAMLGKYKIFVPKKKVL